MKLLSELFSDIDYKGTVDNRQIESIAYDSRKVKDNTLFVAINGLVNDGHKYVNDAINLGANAILINGKTINELSIPVIKVKNTRKILSHLSSHFYNHPSKKIKIVGITGTNGKTTTTQLIDHILKFNNFDSSTLGTLGFQGPSGMINTGFTTPESLELQQIMETLFNSNISHLTMEVSSHALSLHRVDDVDFDIAVFTNLSNEHIDFHGNISNYFNAKLKLFTMLESHKSVILNGDDVYSPKIKLKTKAKVCTYGFNKKNDIFPFDIKMDIDYSEFSLKYNNKTYHICSHLIGKFNIYNIMASILVGIELGLDMKKIISAINSFNQVPGRMQKFITKEGKIIIIDYAHTPDAFNNILLTINDLYVRKKIITLFGCGGNRDYKKRPEMGSIAEIYSDHIILTDDNPRYEDPNKIISDISKGINNKKKYSIINNRQEAIINTINNMKKGTVLMILGKGVEDFQVIKNKKLFHSDSEIVKTFL